MRFILRREAGRSRSRCSKNWMSQSADVRSGHGGGGRCAATSSRYLERVALNKSHQDLEINVLDYWETKPNGRRLHFTWVTEPAAEPGHGDADHARRSGALADRERNVQHAEESRIRIANIMFGARVASTCPDVVGIRDDARLLIDQVEQHCCALFRAAREEEGRLKYLWEEIRAFFLMFRIPDWANPLPDHCISGTTAPSSNVR